MQVDDIAVPHQSAQCKDCTNIGQLWSAPIVENSHVVSPQVGGGYGEGFVRFGRACQ
jgi:hypothetical protein